MGVLLSIIDESFPPNSKFNPEEDIPDLRGKVMIVTGGASGIGKETVKALLSHNAKVYVAARNQTKAEEAIAGLKEATGKEAYFLQLDLASLASVRRAALEFTSKETRLDVLFNNGGVMVPPMSELTVDAYDLQIGTNVLGHFYFTKLLLPILTSTAKKTSEPVRVVNTSSAAQMFDTFRIETFVDGPQRKKEGPQSMYNQSKFANVVFSNELARRYGDEGVVSTALNPGSIKTELQRYYSPVQKKIIDLILYDPPYGAITQLYAGTSPEGVDFNGKFLKPWARISEPRKEALDPAVGKQLWDWLEEQTFAFEKRSVTT